MFKFDFAIDDADEEYANLVQQHQPSETPSTVQQEPFAELPLDHLLASLPSLISYSPVALHPTHSSTTVTLHRRDLFDARFQLISEGTYDGTTEQNEPPQSDLLRSDHASALQFIETPSDIVPGVYEGGLKTWECSLDLVDYMESLKGRGDFIGFHGKRILELGCGTGIPSMYILQALLSSPPNPDAPVTHIHLQDYNASVLELVTLPNLILTWYFSPASASYRTSSLESSSDPDPEQELSITASLKSSFLSSLDSYNIRLRFFSGSWESFDLQLAGGNGTYDILLTSETIYRTESLHPLIALMESACRRPDASDYSSAYLCLVAAKVVYFGVGGGISEFIRAIEDEKATGENARPRGKVEVIWEKNQGVARKIMRVTWN